MANSILPQNNSTQSSNNKIDTYIHWFIILLIIICLCFFIYFMVVLLGVFFSSPQLRESARYVLFVYMLVNDLLYLLLGFTLMMGAIYTLYVPVPVCYILFTASSTALRVTPFTLAAMALEKYVAICHPLRHSDLCTTQRANTAFILICMAMITPYAGELGIMASSLTNIFNLSVICMQENLLALPYQSALRSLMLLLCFVPVAIIILFTYIKIVMVARRASSKSSSASKAKNTVLLHAVHLLLCTGSLLSVQAEVFSVKHVDFMLEFNFLVFTCMPRFLSPLIYGIRDEHLRKRIKKYLPKYSKKIEKKNHWSP